MTPRMPDAGDEWGEDWGEETRFEVRNQDAHMPLEQYERLPKFPVHIVLDNLRSAFNVGSVFRLADTARVESIITCGYTALWDQSTMCRIHISTRRAKPWPRCGSERFRYGPWRRPPTAVPTQTWSFQNPWRCCLATKRSASTRKRLRPATRLSRSRSTGSRTRSTSLVPVPLPCSKFCGSGERSRRCRRCRQGRPT